MWFRLWRLLLVSGVTCWFYFRFFLVLQAVKHTHTHTHTHIHKYACTPPPPHTHTHISMHSPLLYTHTHTSCWQRHAYTLCVSLTFCLCLFLLFLCKTVTVKCACTNQFPAASAWNMCKTMAVEWPHTNQFSVTWKVCSKRMTTKALWDCLHLGMFAVVKMHTSVSTAGSSSVVMWHIEVRQLFLLMQVRNVGVYIMTRVWTWWFWHFLHALNSWIVWTRSDVKFCTRIEVHISVDEKLTKTVGKWNWKCWRVFWDCCYCIVTLLHDAVECAL